jgi:hypothetical protein
VGREVAGRDTLSARLVSLLPIRNRDLEAGLVCRHRAGGAGSVPPGADSDQVRDRSSACQRTDRPMAAGERVVGWVARTFARSVPLAIFAGGLPLAPSAAMLPKTAIAPRRLQSGGPGDMRVGVTE